MLAKVFSFGRSNAIALVALFFAVAGTGLAASRYLITSTAQIKPSVLRELRTSPIAVASALSKTGVHAVVAKARNTTSVEAGTEQALTTVPMSGATWTQHPEEDQFLIGQVTVNKLTKEECGSSTQPETPQLELGVDIPDHPAFSQGQIDIETAAGRPGEGSETIPIHWSEVPNPILPLFPPRTTTTHTLIVRASDHCTGHHIVITEVAIDALGFH